MLSLYDVKQGRTRILLLATSRCDAISRAMPHLQHAFGGISARKAGAA